MRRKVDLTCLDKACLAKLRKAVQSSRSGPNALGGCLIITCYRYLGYPRLPWWIHPIHFICTTLCLLCKSFLSFSLFLADSLYPCVASGSVAGNTFTFHRLDQSNLCHWLNLFLHYLYLNWCGIINALMPFKQMKWIESWQRIDGVLTDWMREFLYLPFTRPTDRFLSRPTYPQILRCGPLVRSPAGL